MSSPPDPPSPPKSKSAAEKILTQEEHLTMEAERLEIQRKRNKVQGEYIEALKNEVELQGVLKALVFETFAQYNVEGKSGLEVVKMIDEALQGAAQSTRELEEAGEAIPKINIAFAQQAEAIEELKKELEDAGEEFDKVNEVLQRFKKTTKGSQIEARELGNSISGVDSAVKSLVGGLSLGLTASSGFVSSIMKLQSELEILKEKGHSVSTSMIAAAMAKQAAIGFANRLGQELKTLAESATDAAAELDKLAGSAENSTLHILGLSGGMLALGVEMGEISKTSGTLMNDTAILGENIADVDKASVQLAASMTTLGVDAKHLADTINILTVNYGLSFEESTKFYESIILDSKLAGQSVADLSDAFSQASDRLYSATTSADQLKKMFTELNLTSRELGVEISDILSLTEKFDKFADAADMAGKLNAQFGLNLSMSKLQRASDEERLEIIRQSFLAQGIQVDQLSLMNKKFITSTLGVKDQATMLRLLGKRRKVENDSVTKLNELLEHQMGAWKKLKAGLAEFALVLSPLIIALTVIVEVLAFVLGGIGRLVAWLPGWLGWIVKITISFFVLKKALAIFAGLMGGTANLIPKVAEKIGEGMKTMAEGTTAFFNALTWENIKKFGAVMLIFAVSVGIAAFGLSYLAEAMKDMSGDTAWAFVAAIAIIMVSMIAFIGFMGYFGPALATALVTAGSGLLYFGGALFIVGAGLALMFYSAAGLAKELGNLADGSFNALIEGLIALSLVSSPLADLKDDLETLNDMANDIDGMVIMKSDGGSRTIMMASESIIKGKTEGSIDVNVHISMDDKINVANEIKVYLDSKELTDAVLQEANKK